MKKLFTFYGLSGGMSVGVLRQRKTEQPSSNKLKIVRYAHACNCLGAVRPPAGYDVSEKNGLAMSHEIDYKGYALLNPLIFFADSTTFRVENAFFLAMPTYSAEVAHRYEQTLTTLFTLDRATYVMASGLLPNDTRRVTIQTKKKGNTCRLIPEMPKLPAMRYNANSSLYRQNTIGNRQFAHTGFNQRQTSFGLYRTNSFILPPQRSVKPNRNDSENGVYRIVMNKPDRQQPIGSRGAELQEKENSRLSINDIFLA